MRKEEIDLLKRWVAAGTPWPEGRTLIARNRADYAAPALFPVKERAVREVLVYPSSVQLDNQRDRQSIVVMARYDNDATEDVTQYTQLTLLNPTLAERRKYTFHPLQDGETQLVAKVAGFEVKVPFSVKTAKLRPALTFELDVLPVFMRERCNTGDCHGSARGKDGFHL